MSPISKFILTAFIGLSFLDANSQEEFFLPFIDSSEVVKLVGYKNQNDITVIPAKYGLDFYIDTLWVNSIESLPTSHVIAIKEVNSNHYLPYVISLMSDNSANELTRFEFNGKMGFIKNNEIIIFPKYDYVSPFVRGFAEYYEGGSKVFLNGCWFVGGDSQFKGYLGKNGNEYTTKESKYLKTGEEYLITCRSHNSTAEQREIVETVSFLENGELASQFIAEKKQCLLEERRHPLAKKRYRQGSFNDIDYYRLNEEGDTTHLKKSVCGKLVGEYRLGQFDYYLDSADTVRQHNWHLIRSFYSNGKLLNIINNDIFYINKNGRKVCKKTFIRQINRKNLKWTYTFLPIEVNPRIGIQINFFIYPDLNSPFNDSHNANSKLIDKGYKIKKRWWYR